MVPTQLADSRERHLAQALLQLVRGDPGASDAAAALVGERERALIAEVAGVGDVTTASADELPRVLAAPPWLGARKGRPRPTVEGLRALQYEERVVWRPGERKQHLH